MWRELHPDTVQYTWRRLEPVQQSRIDYMIVSRHLVENHMVTGVDTQSGVLSDHSVVTLAAKLVSSRFRKRRTNISIDAFENGQPALNEKQTIIDTMMYRVSQKNVPHLFCL